MYPNSLRIEPTNKTPEIILEQGIIFIKGRSIPEDPNNFYRPVYEWISRYISDWKEKTDITFAFEFINTRSIKWIYTILKEISELTYPISKKLQVSWFYEEGDEDMHDLGNIISTLIRCPFRIIKVEDIYKCELNPG